MPDVITTTLGTAGTPGSTAAELINYMSARVLEVAELVTILDQFADKHPMPSNASLTIQFTREEKIAISSTPTQLTQGIPPDATGITISQFTATAEQYGVLTALSDLAELTARHNLVERTIYILGLNAAETYDQLVYNVLDQATSVYRPNGKTSAPGLVGGDTVQAVDLVQLEAFLNSNGARPFESGYYAFVCAPQVYATLLQDPDFKAAAQFKAPEKIWRGEVGELYGFRIIRSNSPAFAATSQTASGSANLVYDSFAIGRFAYQLSDLQNLRVYVVAPGGHTDPLQQSRKIGWKFAFKSIITNQSWMYMVQSAGLNSVTN